MANIRRNRQRPEMISESTTSGWGELHKHVRTTDINKVDDCRDDIDTLLVFAGLYSAVLTAFVIESYTHLQQDTQDVIVGLLQQLVAKNFTSGPGYMNSTNPFPPLPPFEPPVWAIRVNVLWFTSLLLSLASASFGILVKQWLREYLAIDYAAPRERLRARQYRYPAMEDWKVFEIAAFLPLLLQLSLGLFFMGLCFFTAAVHRSIGRTTAPLVCAWVFLLFMTTIAPLFSPRCPFKTTFLKKALGAGRCYIAPSFYDCTQSISAVRQTSFRAVRRWRLAAQRAVRRHWVVLLEFLCRHSSRTSLEGDDDTDEPELHPSGRTEEYISPKIALQEEDEIVRGEREDAVVLLSIDSSMFDDSLLLPMLDALPQSGTTLETTVTLILRIIGRRIGKDLCEKPRLTCTPDLDILPSNVWARLIDVTADAFLLHTAEPLQIDATNSDLLFNAIIIINSLGHRQLSEHAVQTLQQVAVVPKRARGHSSGCSGAVQPYRYLVHDRGTAPDLDKRPCLRCVMDVYTTVLHSYPFNFPPSFLYLLNDHLNNDSQSFMTSSKGVIQDLFHTLLSFLLWTVSSQNDPAEISGSDEALHIILQYSAKFGRRGDAVELCRQMLLTESGSRMCLVQFAALHPQCRVSEDIQGIFWAVPTSSEDNSRIQSHLTAACERFCNGGDDSDDDVPLDYVRLCAAFVGMTDDAGDQALAKAIEKYHRTRGWRKELQRRDYWYSDAPSPTSDELFKEDQALVCRVLETWRIDSTELKDALRLFVPEERSEEMLRSIREHGNPDYTPPTLPAPSTALEESENGQGGTAKGGQEAGDAGQEGTGQDAGRGDAADAEASGGTDVNGVEVPTGGERTEEHDASEREAVDGGDVAGGGGAQRVFAMAGN